VGKQTVTVHEATIDAMPIPNAQKQRLRALVAQRLAKRAAVATAASVSPAAEPVLTCSDMSGFAAYPVVFPGQSCTYNTGYNCHWNITSRSAGVSFSDLGGGVI
jgi:hypothetical protein